MMDSESVLQSVDVSVLGPEGAADFAGLCFLVEEEGLRNFWEDTPEPSMAAMMYPISCEYAIVLCGVRWTYVLCVVCCMCVSVYVYVCTIIGGGVDVVEV